MASDSMVSLASSIHAGPKTFALLIGPGVSASSGVQTGWHVTLHLVRRLAVLRGEDAGGDPGSWYRDHADGDPDYSALLSGLAPSPVDRRNLLKPYFEPTEEERPGSNRSDLARVDGGRKRFRKLNAPELLPLVYAGQQYQDGKPIKNEKTSTRRRLERAA